MASVVPALRYRHLPTRFIVKVVIMKKYAITIFMLLGLSGCELMGWYKCSSLSGYCKPRKPAAIDFWDIQGEKPPRMADYENMLADGQVSVNDYAFRSASAEYMTKKVKVFEQCGLEWHIRDLKPLVQTFGQEGFDCLERNGLYRNSLSEDVRF